jgi:hypothetical protein
MEASNQEIQTFKAEAQQMIDALQMINESETSKVNVLTSEVESLTLQLSERGQEVEVLQQDKIDLQQQIEDIQASNLEIVQARDSEIDYLKKKNQTEIVWLKQDTSRLLTEKDIELASLRAVIDAKERALSKSLNVLYGAN